jgi:hypothetical protein
VLTTGDDEQIAQPGSDERSRDARHEGPPVTIEEQRLGRSHAHRITGGEYDGRKHTPS